MIVKHKNLINTKLMLGVSNLTEYSIDEKGCADVPDALGKHLVKEHPDFLDKDGNSHYDPTPVNLSNFTKSGAKADNSELRIENEELKSEVNALNEELEAFKKLPKDVKGAKKAIDELEFKVKGLETEKATLETENADLKTQIEELKTQISEEPVIPK